MKYTFPIERPLTRGAINFCMGPFIEGSTQVQQYVQRWIAWVATDGIRYAKFEDGTLYDDTAGQLTDLWSAPRPRPAKFSFSFEQDALHAVALQDGATIRLRRKVSGVPTEYSWTGKSPCLFYNGIVEPDTSATDLICLYLPSAGDKILVRLQRDNFGVEYELNTDLRTTLAELHQTDSIKIGGVLYQQIWGLDTAGQQVFFNSAPYPPFPEFASDRISLVNGLDDGLYFSPIVPAFAPGDAVTMLQGLVDGAYVSVIVNATSPGDAVSMLQGLVDGVYLNVIVPATAPSDSLSMLQGLEDGAYVVQAIPSNAPSDKISMDNGLSGGVYS